MGLGQQETRRKLAMDNKKSIKDVSSANISSDAGRIKNIILLIPHTLRTACNDQEVKLVLV